MTDTNESTEKLEEIIEGLTSNMEKALEILEHLELDGTEDTTQLKENLATMHERIEKNQKTVDNIRKTAE